MSTSKKEGEILNRNSVRVSIRRYLGLSFDQKHIASREEGITLMMQDIEQNFSSQLTHKTLYQWNE